jgi:hypothetical protein
MDAADSSTITLSSSAITQWNDKSTSGNHFVQATTANSPTVGTSANGLPTIYFATTNQQLVSSQNSATSGNASRTVIQVFWCPTLSSAYYSVTGTESMGNPPTAWGHAKNANADVTYPFMYSSAGDDVFTVVNSTPNPLITYAQYNSTGSSFSSYYATSGATNGTTTVGNFVNKTMTFNTTAGVWYLGRRQQAATGSVTSHLLEMIHFNKALSTTERQQVEGYLAQKWALTELLTAGHPGLTTTLFRADYTKQNAMTARPYYIAFSPRQISGCSLWLDGADPAGNGVIPAIGTSIATWVDKSGLSQTITQANSSNQAVYSSGGGLTFTSGKQYPLNTSVFMTMFSVAYTIFIIEKRALSGTFFIIGNTAGGGGPLYIGYQSTTAMRFTTASVIDMDYSIPAYSGSDATEPIRIWAFRWFGSAANLRDIGLNGQLSPQTQAFNQAPSFSGNQTIGASAYGNYVGRLYEIIIFNKAISDSEKQKVESYLAQKWGLVSSLPGGHLNATQPAGAITLTALTNFRILSRSRGSPITSTTLNTIATYLRNYMSEFRNPSFYGYNLDGNSYHINDGGGDMYDAGNWTYPWLISGTQYTNANGNSQQAFSINYSSTTATTVDTDFVYASLGYAQSSGTTITSNHPLTVLGFRTSAGTPVGFQLGGNSGADGGGTLASGILYAGDIIQGFTVHAFYRETYNAGDPSHCNLFILLGHSSWISVFGTISSFADPVANGGNGCFFYTSGAGVSNILAIQTLLSKSGGVLVTAAECQTVVQAFVNRVKLAVGF